MNILTTKLASNGATVLAKLYKGEPSAVTYANRTQAQRKAAELGEGWEVARWGRPFYVARFDAPIAPDNCHTPGPWITDDRHRAQMITTHRLILCLSRGAVEWWKDPRTSRFMLRTRAGRLFDAARTATGWRLSERQDRG